ncbi:hypothetical protein CAOG_00965 [Capsaspora owczarzaki ATCC 30864]|uniref:G-protein coupled receptors family 2 profile 2 domain-containing protein n=1 Tax=Capsaspora owczarzaki (strain ATCC 30864) TaxID=595528 RepID=A0A0D2WJG7_CAPO3|nr:hypothetical protein CAOG_00965 [Capsaspora owczarzaki ATCC 30864]KJE89508.1 hypothetical protein CAOG_000965 [Capsaspora owczarzaki ATCC 30864]|eukprot:XP_004365836.1 hypothetical protein CAOG_00965 [Capsaspora owczarzaki ATCC 30864]
MDEVSAFVTAPSSAFDDTLTPTTASPWSEGQQTALKAATVTTCCLSIVGCVLIILSFVLLKDLRATSRQLLVFLSLADLVTAMGNMVGVLTDDTGTLCVIQSSFTTYSSIASFLWTSSIALYLYLSIARESQRLAARSIPFLHVFSWLTPACIIIAALACEVLGSDDFSATTVGWCWIKSNVKYDLFWKLFAGKGWEIASYISVPILYFFVKRKIRVELHSAEQIQLVSRRSVQVAQEADRKMTFIPIVFVFVRSWGTTRFLISEIGSQEQADVFWLTLCQAIGDSSQGFANFVLFCVLTPKIRNRMIALVWPQYRGSNADESQRYSGSVATTASAAKSGAYPNLGRGSFNQVVPRSQHNQQQQQLRQGGGGGGGASSHHGSVDNGYYSTSLSSSVNPPNYDPSPGSYSSLSTRDSSYYGDT